MTELMTIETEPGPPSDVVLSEQDRADLEKLETVIQEGLKTFLEVGVALDEIRTRRLYKLSHTTFQAYCQERFDFTRQYASLVIQASRIALEVSAPSAEAEAGEIEPQNERQVRALNKLNDKKQRKAAWKQALKAAGGQQPSVRQVREAVEAIIGKPAARKAAAQAEAPDHAETVTLDGETTAAVLEAAAAAQAKTEQLSDGDWLATLPLHRRLGPGPRRKFEMDALLYRRTEGAKRVFAYAVANVPNKGQGAYAYLLTRFLKLDHPSRWVLCPPRSAGGCNGTGQTPDIGQCSQCHGRGYRIV